MTLPRDWRLKETKLQYSCSLTLGTSGQSSSIALLHGILEESTSPWLCTLTTSLSKCVKINRFGHLGIPLLSHSEEFQHCCRNRGKRSTQHMQAPDVRCECGSQDFLVASRSYSRLTTVPQPNRPGGGQDYPGWMIRKHLLQVCHYHLEAWLEAGLLQTKAKQGSHPPFSLSILALRN